MNIQSFVNKWNGKYLEFDGAYWNQCVDLTKDWQSENGWPVMSGNAIQWAGNHSGYTWVPNGIHNKPDPGDIVVFKSGAYGHIGVCVNADYVNLTCFEQNNPLRTPCHLVFHRWYGLHTSMPVYGWLKRN